MCNEVSDDFKGFLRSLGWPVELASHAGFKGPLLEDLCPSAPYYSDFENEVVFVVPYLFRGDKADSPTDAMFPRLAAVTDPFVQIVWLEDLNDLATFPVKSFPEEVIFLFVHPFPLSPGLYFVKVSVHDEQLKDLVAS